MVVDWRNPLKSRFIGVVWELSVVAIGTRSTNPTITHANKVMHALADCVKALHGMTSSARNSQAAKDLQRIIDATQAHVQAQPDRFEDVATPSTTPNMQQVLRV
jgi:hypothetical protein